MLVWGYLVRGGEGREKEEWMGGGTFLNLPMSQAWSSFGQWPGKSVEVTFVTISASTPTTCTNSSQLRARETAREGNPLAAGLRDQRKAFAARVCVW